MWAMPKKPWFVAVAAAALVAGVLLVSSFVRSGEVGPLLCPLGGYLDARITGATAELKDAVLHYATSKYVPQQSLSEIHVTYAVLRRRAPCNFLVFGLGLDSAMWSALNAGGTTVFLEESVEWVQKVLKDAPWLRAHTVPYRTRLDEADGLMRSYRSEPDCLPPAARVRGNLRCRLALAELPAEVDDREWDLIMIDAPRGFSPALPGRMAAIWSAAVLARARRGPGATDVFLHDVDRKVEKAFAMEFLCKKYLVGGSGRLWHFRIPPANGTAGAFC